MVNLFQNMSDMSDDELRLQIAMLHSVTLSNAASSFTQGAASATVSAIRGIAGLFGKKIDMEKPEVQTVEDRIKEDFFALQSKSRAALEMQLRDALRLRLSDGKNLGSDTELSRQIVLEAAKNYDHIKDGLTVAQKTDRIAFAYLDKIRDNVAKKLKNQSDKEVEDTVRRMDESIAQMTPEEQLQVKESLNLRELTGKTMRNALLSVGIPASALKVSSGMGAFIAMTTVMHAVFTTALGITLPFAAYSGTMAVLGFLTGPVGWLIVGGILAYQVVSGARKIDREMLSQYVYTAFVHRRRLFAPREEELAGWSAYAERGKSQRLLPYEAAGASKEEMYRTLDEARRAQEKELEAYKRVVQEEAARKIEEIRVQAAAEKEREMQTIREQYDEICERMEQEMQVQLEKMRIYYEKVRAQKTKDASKFIYRLAEEPSSSKKDTSSESEYL